MVKKKHPIYFVITSANPRLLRHGESCDYMLSSFKHRNKNKIQKIHLLIIMKTPLLYHLKQTSWQSMDKWRSFRTSKFTLMLGLSGLKFFSISPQTHKDQTSEKIEGNSKFYLQRIIKTPLVYHFKLILWKSMHNWRSFKTSKVQRLLLCYQGWNFSKSTNTLRTNFWPKKKKKKIISPQTLRSNFWKKWNKIQKFIPCESFKPFCLIIKSKLHVNQCINEEVLGLQSSLLCYQDWNFSKSTSALKSDLKKKIIIIIIKKL